MQGEGGYPIYPEQRWAKHDYQTRKQLEKGNDGHQLHLTGETQRQPTIADTALLVFCPWVARSLPITAGAEPPSRAFFDPKKY